jgi:RHS repeat-associated protein
VICSLASSYSSTDKPEKDNLGAVIREYIWLDGRPLAVVEGGQVFWLHWDHILRPVLATDATGAVVWAARYLPFGGIDQVLADTGALTQTLRFPGQWFQAETGLHQNGMRDYDPTTGRYLQADPLGLVDGASVYGYARQSPVRWTDPLGYYTLGDAMSSLRRRYPWSFHSAAQIFDEWLRLERGNTQWLDELTPCPQTIDQCVGEEWEESGPANPLHVPGVYEVRSKPTPGRHSNQCVYDAAGKLMVGIPSGGTADYKAYEGFASAHTPHDVAPYFLANVLGRDVDYYSVRPVVAVDPFTGSGAQ